MGNNVDGEGSSSTGEESCLSLLQVDWLGLFEKMQVGVFDVAFDMVELQVEVFVAPLVLGAAEVVAPVLSVAAAAVVVVVGVGCFVVGSIVAGFV